MQAQLACVLLLCLPCGVLCSDVDQEQRAIEEELLNSLFTSKMKQSKQGAPYWRVSLVNVCRMVNSLMNSLSWREQEEYNTEEELWERLASLPEPLDKLLDLLQICRVLQPREVLDADRNRDNPLKRKSPYIFKRQVKNTKARRPYILKRSTFY
ncbi:neurotensin/neuromedin N-like [Oncorhynchus tshawytscha]|uniref:neurotensin/neuromedin N-like n=1 Tax=Oncorhynchus tshawytscha TaxID=74940 RepID=UPI000D0A0558|nr:neurotensin/neuromedin N-like [Oncorhynchus tshawytscha]XP_035653625.1 neurotensin/neuromedin N-like [Oncorhynchus keta]